MQDNGQRGATETREQHLIAVLRGIRGVNQLIAAEDDPERLIAQACDRLTATMGYHNAWIALLGGEAGRELGLVDRGAVATTAAAGFNGDFDAMRQRLLRGDFSACMGRALEATATVVTGNPTADCPDCPLAGDYGGRAGLTRRLDFDGVIYGILSASVPANYAEDAEEQELFDELARDLAFGLQKIATARQLDESRQRYRDLFENHSAAKLIIDPDDGRIVGANAAAARFYGWSRDELCRMKISDINTLTPAQIKTEMERARTLERSHFEFEHRRADGSVRGVAVYSSKVESGGRELLYSIIHDVTEHKRADEWRRFVIEGARLGTWEWNVQTDETVFNEQWAAMLGYTLDELTPYDYGTWERLVHPEDIERTTDALKRCASGETPDYSCEFRMRHKDGHWVWILDRGSVMTHDSNEKPLSMFGTHTDITQIKEQKARIASLGQMLDEAPAAITIHDIDGNFLFSNRRNMLLHGYDSEEEFLAVKLHDLDVPESAEKLAERFRLIDEEGSARFEVAHHRKDGSIIPLEVQAKQIEWAGRPAVLSIATDITERKRAEEEILSVNQQLRASEQKLRAYNQQLDASNQQLKATEQQLRAIEQQLRSEHERLQVVMQTAPIAILMTDEHERIIQSNRAAESLFGAAGDIEGEPLRCGDVIACVHRHESPKGCGHGESCASCEVYRAIRNGLAGVTVNDLETEIHTERNGANTRRQILLSAAPLRTGGRPGVILVANDITQMRALHAHMAQSDRLLSMGMLAAGVAHEINNPLSYVLYNLESLVADLPNLIRTVRDFQAEMESPDTGTSSNRRAELARVTNPIVLEDILARFEDALEGTHRIRDIARGLGTFSRVEKSQAVPVNLMHVVDVALSMAFNEIKYRARLVKDYGRIPTIMASEGRLSQVFLNLVINATHAIDEGDVDNNEIRVRTWAEGDAVFAEVRDTGSGIAPENLDKLFEPFFSTKKMGSGSGLGLAISKSIVEGYGGDISVESALGEGTAFVVRLPVRSGAVDTAAEDAPKTEDEASVRGRILIVDDEAGIRAAVVRMLQEHETVEASSGSEAKELLESDQRFDLILCDMMMPELSGMDLHQWLQGAHPTLAERLVFVTGGAFTPRARDYLNGVGNLRLEKPFDVANFKKIVGSLIREALTQDGRR